jgi:hypothetical protein
MQLASGSDLVQSHGNPGLGSATARTVNRDVKADRFTVAATPAGHGQTISFKVHSLHDTSVLMRLPVERSKVEAEPRKAPVIRPVMSQRRNAVACEPVVSVLTEVAKLLEPGRCVT